MISTSTILPTERKVFCNRTINFRSLQAIGYDMDYTLIHYHVEEWEERAYEHLKQQLLQQGWPVGSLRFDPKLVCRGLVIDTEKGNLVKANRFGFVKHALHGTSPLEYEDLHRVYSRTIVDLSEKRWIFLNTLFSLSEGCIYAQLVDLLDQRQIPEVLGYIDLYEKVKSVLEFAHMEGELKADIIANPDRFVQLEPDVPLTLLDQYHSGKKLLLITNSEWHYTSAMMNYTFNQFLPENMQWKDLFELIIVGARKPHFFITQQPFFEVIDKSGHLKPATGKLQKGTVYLGGSAHQVEEYLGLSGDEVLYIGDHMFGDVHVTKNVLRWRTGLILRELEEDIQAERSFISNETYLNQIMLKKEILEAELCLIKLHSQRKRLNYATSVLSSDFEPEARIHQIRDEIEKLDLDAAPLAKAYSKLNNPIWGLLLRAGRDKSYLAYQLERYADIYTSRVSNFLACTPYSYLHSKKSNLPHDVL